ncbi:MAG: hypothetical protein KatS3mg096_067 [Candidatus Parcubacteria bacterium]|nr:MAG: hypothetical protein KatS3mg096_067 [Candidatus Parcubacteria bacterium]
MKKRVIIGIIILLIVALIVILGYFRSKSAKEKAESPGVIEVEQPPQSLPLPINQITSSIPSIPTLPTATTEPTKTYQLLFNQSFIYLDLDYPLLYVYDPQQEIIKYLSLEDETYREIAKIPNLKQGWLSEDKTKIVIETNNGFSLIDIKADKLDTLPIFTQKVVLNKNIILYLSNDKDISYIAYFNDKTGDVKKIRNLGILNPDFAILKNGILIYEQNSPVLFLDFKNQADLSLFLDIQTATIIPNKNKDLIFMSFKKNDIWQSQIIDINKKLIYSFSWAAIKDKCTFDEILVCALTSNFNDSSPSDWYSNKTSVDDKIVIYYPQNNKLEEIQLEGKFDFVRPKLTPLGIIAWNRLDAKFYLLKIE